MTVCTNNFTCSFCAIGLRTARKAVSLNLELVVFNIKLYPIRLEWKKISFITLILISGFFVSKASADNLFINILITGFYPMGLFGFGILKMDSFKSRMVN